MAAVTIGLTNLTFGTLDESTYVVRSFEESITCDPVELLSGDGTFSAVALANPRTTTNITLVTTAISASVGSLTVLNSNSMLTGEDTDIYISSSNVTLTNDGFAEIQISAEGWKNLNQTS